MKETTEGAQIVARLVRRLPEPVMRRQIAIGSAEGAELEVGLLEKEFGVGRTR